MIAGGGNSDGMGDAEGCAVADVDVGGGVGAGVVGARGGAAALGLDPFPMAGAGGDHAGMAVAVEGAVGLMPPPGEVGAARV